MRLPVQVILRGSVCAAMLAACLAVALLPAGRMPKLLGPCGRSLCECPLQAAPLANSRPCDGKDVSIRKVLTFGETSVSRAVPVLDFQIIFTGLIHSAPAELMCAARLAGERVTIEVNSATKSYSRDIPVPPPRG